MISLNQADKNPGLCVAIIDDGVNVERFATGKLIFDIEISASLEFLERNNYDSAAPSHGAGCAAIIKKYAPDARIGSIKILNDDHRGLAEYLVKAFNWCISNRIRIIHLSLGTVYFKDFPEIQSVVNTFSDKGGITIAACNNRNIVTYPASLSNVIGVRFGNKHQLKGSQFYYNRESCDGIEFSANGRHELFRDNKKVETSPSNSIAAPVITAVAWNILKEHPDLEIEAMKEEIYTKAINFTGTDYPVSCLTRMDWINAAVVCCVETIDIKKMIRFSFEVSAYCRFNGWSNDSVYNEIFTCIGQHPSSDTFVIFAREFDNKRIDRLSSMVDELKKNMILCHEDSILLKKIGMKRFYHVQIKPHGEISGAEMTDIPVVSFFNDTSIPNTHIVKQISDEFRNRGYHSLNVSDKVIGVLEGFEYVDKPSGKYLNYLATIHDPDIIFLSGKTEDTFEEDFEVHISSSGDELLIEKEFVFLDEFEKICDYIEHTLVNAKKEDLKKRIRIKV